jgi:hypothetical protein
MIDEKKSTAPAHMLTGPDFAPHWSHPADKVLHIANRMLQSSMTDDRWLELDIQEQFLLLAYIAADAVMEWERDQRVNH